MAQRLLERVAPTLDKWCQQLPSISERIPYFQPMTVELDALPISLAARVFTRRQEQFERDLQQLSSDWRCPSIQPCCSEAMEPPPHPILSSAPTPWHKCLPSTPKPSAASIPPRH